jgi:hypothetical protein
MLVTMLPLGRRPSPLDSYCTSTRMGPWLAHIHHTQPYTPTTIDMLTTFTTRSSQTPPTMAPMNVLKPTTTYSNGNHSGAMTSTPQLTHRPLPAENKHFTHHPQATPHKLTATNCVTWHLEGHHPWAKQGTPNTDAVTAPYHHPPPDSLIHEGSHKPPPTTLAPSPMRAHKPAGARANHSASQGPDSQPRGPSHRAAADGSHYLCGYWSHMLLTLCHLCCDSVSNMPVLRCAAQDRPAKRQRPAKRAAPRQGCQCTPAGAAAISQQGRNSAVPWW